MLQILRQSSIRFSQLSKWISLVIILAFGTQASLAAQMIQSATRTVCPIGCDHITIQGAITAANPGDTIQMATTEAHTEYDIVVNKNVIIKGLGGSIKNIIQAAASQGTAPNRVFTIQTGVKATIQDLEIRYGVSGLGGGIYNDGGNLTINNVDVFQNENSGVYNTGTMTINNSTIAENETKDNGGGIWNIGTLRINNSAISKNSSRYLGGGVFNSGTLTIYDSYITTNEAQGDTSSYGGHGGGIANTESLTLINSIINFNKALVGGSMALSYGAGIYSSGDVWIRGSTIQNNSGDKYLDGGGIYTINGNMQLYEVTIKDNSKVAYGGGIYVESGMIHINSSVINGNSSAIGGGVYAFGGDLNLSNVTISGNTAYDDGGGIYVRDVGMVNLANVTITDNSADFDQDETGTGGGVYVYSSGGPGIITSPVNMRNSIIAWNMDPTGLIVRAQDCYGLIGSDGYNLIGWLGIPINNRPCTVIGDKTGNIIGQPVQLGPLADNDGPTQTHALLSNSPAINAGNPAGCRDYDDILLTSDQRRGLRVDRCDIGAFELGALTKHMNLPLVVK